MTTVHEALQAAIETLSPTSPTPRLDAQVLLAHVLRFNRTRLFAEPSRPLAPSELSAFQVLIKRRAALEPVAYLTHHKEFYGLDFYVDQRVLVPRPETELLVDLALSRQKHQAAQTAPSVIADIGTGSGCIAVSLAVHVPSARVYAVDLSLDALAVAEINVQRHGVGERVRLLHGNSVAPLPASVDLLVSNPPYTIVADVDENVRRWEPHLALDGGGAAGFDVPITLIRQLPTVLAPHGTALIEIGAWQGALALQVAAAVFPAATITIHKDLAGLDRVLAIETPAQKTQD